MPDTRRLRPILRVGQHTSQTREFRIVDPDGDPVDVTGADVSLSMEHDKLAYTAIDGGDVTIIDGVGGFVEYDFSAEDTALHGRYRVQFEVDWGDETALYPPDDHTWVLDVGRRIPETQPFSAPRITADEGTFTDLQVERLDVDEASISVLDGDPEISELSIETLDVEAFTGGVVGTRGPLVRLDGPDLYIDENGALAWQDPTDGGFTDGSDHDHGETGSGGDTLRPSVVGTTDNPVEEATLNTAVVAEELGLPEYSDVTNAPQAQGRVVYATGDGASEEGIYKHDGDAYAPVDTGLLDGEDFDGQGASSFTNLASVDTEDAEITATDAENQASAGVTDDAQLWLRGNSGSAIGAAFRGSDDPDSGTDKASLAWYHQDVDHILAKIVAHATDNHWSLYTTPYAASYEAGADTNQFRKRLDVNGGGERTKVNWRNLSAVEYRPADHADAGSGDFNVTLRQATADDRTEHVYADPDGAAKFAAGYNEFDQYFIEDLGGTGVFFRFDKDDSRPTLDHGVKVRGGEIGLGQNPITSLRRVSNASSEDLATGEFALDMDRGGTGAVSWLAKDSGGNVHYWDADGTL